MIKGRNKSLFWGAALLFALTASSYGRKKEATVADTVVVHGKVYTANRTQPWVEAVAIRGGKIIAAHVTPTS